MAKGIYIQLLSRMIKTKEQSTSSLNKSVNDMPSTDPQKYAGDVLTVAFHKFKIGEANTARNAIRRLMQTCKFSGKAYYACQLSLALGHLRFGLFYNNHVWSLWF